jgi:aerotaxis receptor
LKINLPVSANELPFPRGNYLVSKTDLKGAITHANEAFVRISGFTREELIGNSHNIVRHPDMPEEAFADLWHTVKLGLPWHGLVKNRAKNGDCYWVRAMVVPVRKDGRTTGYMSVRTEPGRDEIREAESLYAAIKGGRAKFPSVETGVLARLSFATRLWLVMGSLSTLMAAIAAAALFGGAEAAARWFIGSGALLASFGSLSVGFYFSWRVRRPLDRVAAIFSQIAEGNLTNAIDVSGRDETGSLLCQLDAMQVALLAMLDDIATASSATEQRCRDLEARLAQINEQSERQFDSAKSVAAATQQLSVSVREVAHSAGETRSAAQRADELVATGNRRIGESLEVSERVARAVQRSGATITQLTAAIARIGEISTVIKDIAGQTNLLALNAAIEAARAGDQGRGFAVVADEVRKLAEKTTKSTATIGGLLAEVEAAAGRAVTDMNSAEREVAAGMASMQESAVSLKGVTRASKDATDMALNISSATVQQSQASEEVADNMERMSQLIEGNLQAAQAAKHAAAELMGTSGTLRALIGNFRLHAA